MKVDNDLLYRYVYLQCSPEEVESVHTLLKTDFSRCFEVIKMMRERAAEELPLAAAPSSMPSSFYSSYDEVDEEAAWKPRKQCYAPARETFFSRMCKKVMDFINEGEEPEEDEILYNRPSPSMSYYNKQSIASSNEFLMLLDRYLAESD